MAVFRGTPSKDKTFLDVRCGPHRPPAVSPTSVSQMRSLHERKCAVGAVQHWALCFAGSLEAGVIKETGLIVTGEAGCQFSLSPLNQPPVLYAAHRLNRTRDAASSKIAVVPSVAERLHHRTSVLLHALQ